MRVLKVKSRGSSWRMPHGLCNIADGENILGLFSNDISKTTFYQLSFIASINMTFLPDEELKWYSLAGLFWDIIINNDTRSIYIPSSEMNCRRGSSGSPEINRQILINGVIMYILFSCKRGKKFYPLL